MTSLNVGNCPACGRIFTKNPQNLCPSCIKELEKQYFICTDYLREHRNATIDELSENTEVPEKVIMRFIREGRISIDGIPFKSAPCEVCGAFVRESRLCDDCRARLSRDVSKMKEEEKFQASKKMEQNVYMSQNHPRNPRNNG